MEWRSILPLKYPPRFIALLLLRVLLLLLLLLKDNGHICVGTQKLSTGQFSLGSGLQHHDVSELPQPVSHQPPGSGDVGRPAFRVGWSAA